MVEMAIIFPFLLLLVISVMDYGHYLETTNDIATVVRDGARYASLNPSSLGTAATCGNGWGASSGTTTPCPSDTIQGVIQAEAEALTVPAGGLNVANTNCTWGSSATPPNLSSPPSSPDPPQGTSCMTIAYFSSDATGTAYCAYYVASSTSLSGSCTGSTEYVQITVAFTTPYADNPITTVFNSVFHLLDITSYQTYTMMVVP
jgi:Flp pilus assembly protein TadG